MITIKCAVIYTRVRVMIFFYIEDLLKNYTFKDMKRKTYKELSGKHLNRKEIVLMIFNQYLGRNSSMITE